MTIPAGRASGQGRGKFPRQSVAAGLPSLALALDPVIVEVAIREMLGLRGERALPPLRSIELVKLRSRRRAVLRFGFGPSLDGRGEIFLIGKIRAKGVDRRVHRVACALRERGFVEMGGLGFTVPESLGCVRGLALNLQRGYAGTPLTERFREEPPPVTLLEQVGRSLGQLHVGGVVSDRIHTVADELAILERELPPVAAARPELATRIEALLETARRIAPSIAGRPLGPAHRDFHPDQILVDGERLVLLDLDLYAFADPLIDVANFIAHLRELGLRTRGDAWAFRRLEDAFLAGHVAVIGERDDPRALSVWLFLSLLRHVAIGWRIEVRRAGLVEVVRSCEALEVHADA